MSSLSITPIQGVPMVRSGDNLTDLCLQAATDNQLDWQPGDVLCVAQKIVSKAEDRLVQLSDVEPGNEAKALAERTDKDPRLVQLILDESSEILRERPGILIVRHRLGIVGANAGIDQSNIDHGDDEAALLLPVDPDASAARLSQSVSERVGCHVGVIITDSHNRPWRLGTVGSAIGCAGVEVLQDHRGGNDLYGRELKVTLINRADSIASAATLVMGETTERVPLALVRGLAAAPLANPAAHTAASIHRPLQEDLFR